MATAHDLTDVTDVRLAEMTETNPQRSWGGPPAQTEFGDGNADGTFGQQHLIDIAVLRVYRPELAYDLTCRDECD